jgi:hypothetical protein
VIGLIGVTGAVGIQAARQLAASGAPPLRLGGRNLAAAQQMADQLPAEAVAMRVDVDDDVSLAAFVAGCELVVNCSGPSHRTAARVARAAAAAGAHHVDAGGDGLLEAPARRCAVYAAGAVPGLSGLLPRWLAAGDFDAVNTLTSYSAVFDRFTASAAEDYLHGALGADSEPLAAWSDGARRPAALTRRPQVTLPFLPREVSAVPYLDREAVDLARDLSLTHGRWYSVLDGEHLPAALDAARMLPTHQAVDLLCRATALDTAGRSPSVVLTVQLDGTAAGRPATRTAVLRAPGVARLTGSVTAAAALAVLDGRVPVGAWHAATVLDPAAAVAHLTDACELTVFDLPIDQLTLAEEGAL